MSGRKGARLKVQGSRIGASHWARPSGLARFALRLVQPLLGGVLLLTAVACQDKAAHLLEIGQFEELQNNPQHARELYEELIRDYPQSEQATTARARLAKLKPPE